MRMLAERRAAELANRNEAMRTDLAGQLVALAASAGQTAEDGVGRNSPYTGSLVLALSQQERSFADALYLANSEVLRATRGVQRPLLSSDMNGQFFLWRGPPDRRISALVVSSDRWNKNLLQNADNDAESWTELLQSANINVQRLRNPGARQLLDALEFQAGILASKHGDLPSGLVHRTGLAVVERVVTSPINTVSVMIFLGMGGVELGGENFLALWPDFQQSKMDDLTAEDSINLLRERAVPLTDVLTRLRNMAAASIFVFDSAFFSIGQHSSR